MNKHIKIIRLTTVPQTIKILLEEQLLYLSNFFTVIVITSPGKALKNLNFKNKIKIYIVKMYREINIISDFISTFYLIKIFLRESPSIIHSNSPKSSLLSMFSGWITRIKVRVYTISGFRFEGKHGLARLTLILFEKITCFFSTHILCESIGIKNKALQIGIPESKCILLNPSNLKGVNTDIFNPILYNSSELRSVNLINENTFVFLFIGRVVVDKGIFELIKAFNSFSKIILNSQLIIVGPIELDSKNYINLESYISFNTSIKLLGNQDDVRSYIALSNCIILPSYREGFPNVILEAGSMGKPVIMTKVNGHHEYLNSETGLLVEIANSDDLLEKMNVLYSNYKNYNSAKIRKFVIEHFDSVRVNNSMQQFYKNLINLNE